MQPARSMLLNDESRRSFDLFWNRLACRFGSFFKIAFSLVFGQRHYNQNKPRITRIARISDTKVGRLLRSEIRRGERLWRTRVVEGADIRRQSRNT
jgi:hypothetical protein